MNWKVNDIFKHLILHYGWFAVVTSNLEKPKEEDDNDLLIIRWCLRSLVNIYKYIISYF